VIGVVIFREKQKAPPDVLRTPAGAGARFMDLLN
jgi:hypothetical protein